jgi:hypothetical protein
VIKAEELAPELDALLGVLGRLDFTFHLFGADRNVVDALAGVRSHGAWADVVILFDEDRAVAYRVPTGPGRDVFDPTDVFWWYGVNPADTLRALIAQPAAPADLEPFGAPAGFGIPQELRANDRIRKWSR